ncbi:MAG: hypothetical protein MR593_01170 [Intestinibacter sp.]|uniref:hypothetical protein n=1 Tax=Intestinibacter sp. TaxID=1965304 RepID=UPI0025C70B44|nr:hypothetical protein [Intestinibacter sp.]MCI6736721.1 hypothetical protein [Intestinibacter sp.]
MIERINIQEYLDMIKRRRVMIIVILLVSLALGAFKAYRNYVSFVPKYTSTVVVKIDSMKVQKEEVAKEAKKNKKKSSKTDENSTDGNGTTTQQEDQPINYFNYSIISQDESISSRYYTFMENSTMYSKVAQVAGVRAKQIYNISASQDETRLEVIYLTITTLDKDSAQKAAAAVPEVFNTELLKEIGIDCVSTVYEATEAQATRRPRDKSILQFGMAGLVFAIFLVLLLECLNTKIITPDDVEKYWDLPLLGVVPMFDENPKGQHRKKKK